MTTYSPDHLLEAYWDGVLPVNPGAIALKIGLKLVIKPDMAEVGKVELGPDGFVVVSVNSASLGPRQRFTIAHEIGHYALGHLNQARPVLRDDISSFSTGTFDGAERAANKFAMALLMPERVVKFAIVERKITSLAKLAEMFSVSEVAMRARLVELNILN